MASKDDEAADRVERHPRAQGGQPRYDGDRRAKEGRMTRGVRTVIAEWPCCLAGALVVPCVLGAMALLSATRQTRSLSVEEATQFGTSDASVVPVDPGVVLADDPGALTHFVHVTDTHVSVHRPEWAAQFEDLVMNHLPAIQPRFVVHTGDLTEAKWPSPTPAFHGEQVVEEWETHASILRRGGWWDASKWVEVRGNHDCLGVFARDSQDNLFNTYSVSGEAKPDSDAVLVFDAPPQRSTPGVSASVRVVTLDQTPTPGLSTPFNIMGRVDDSTARVVEDALQASLPRVARDARGANFSNVLVAGHYPLGFVHGTSLDSVLAENSGTVSAYLAGHTHSSHMWSRLGPNSGSDGHGGILELEGDDMFMSKVYRVMAFDHGLMSFIDTPIDTWPVILVTNPKDARLLDAAEPNALQPTSTHIRMLIFSPANVSASEVTAQIDGETVCGADSADITASDAYAGLFTCAWQPSEYAEGLHEISVTATDKDGSQATATTEFSLDGTGAALGLSGAALRQPISTPSMYTAAVILSALLLGVVGIGVGHVHLALCAARRQPQWLTQWRERLGRMRAVEAAGHTDAALAAAFGEAAGSACFRLKTYATWGLLRHLWRASLLPTRVAVALGVIVVWMSALPFLLGPFVPGTPDYQWSIAGTWGVVVLSTGEYYPASDMIFASAMVLVIWTLPLFTFVFLPSDTAAIPALSGARGAAWHAGSEGAPGGGDGSSDTSGQAETELVALTPKLPQSSGDVESAGAEDDTPQPPRGTGVLTWIRHFRRDHEQVSSRLGLTVGFLTIAASCYYFAVLWDAFGPWTAIVSPVGLPHALLTYALLVDAVRRDAAVLAARRGGKRA